MRKYILILLLAVNSVCFAQNSMKTTFEFNKIQIRLNGRVRIFKKPLYTFFIVRESRLELYKELFIKINNNMFLRPAIGVDYRFSTSRITPKARLDFIGNFDKYFFNIVYGSSLINEGVSTRLEYKFTKRFFAGFQTANELIGPRIDYRFLALYGKKFKVGAYYLSKDIYGLSFRFDIFEFFPKLEEKKNLIENWFNGHKN